MPPTKVIIDGRVQIVARIPKELRARLDEVAERRNISLTALVTELLTAGLSNETTDTDLLRHLLRDDGTGYAHFGESGSRPGLVATLDITVGVTADQCARLWELSS